MKRANKEGQIINNITAACRILSEKLMNKECQIINNIATASLVLSEKIANKEGQINYNIAVASRVLSETLKKGRSNNQYYCCYFPDIICVSGNKEGPKYCLRNV